MAESGTPRMRVRTRAARKPALGEEVRLERTTGCPSAREDIAHISPLVHKRVIPSGTYQFDRASKPAALS